MANMLTFLSTGGCIYFLENSGILREFFSTALVDTMNTDSINDVITNFGSTTKEFDMLRTSKEFGHAFTRCDSISGIYNFRKASIFLKLEKSLELQSLAKTFYQDKVSSADIGKNSIKMFEIIF